MGQPPEDFASRRDKLSERKRDILAQRLRGQAPPPKAYPPAEPAPGGKGWPLSSAQRRMWFFHQLQPRSAVYHIPFAVHLRGNLNLPALQSALDALVLRHESLRTRFPAEGGEPLQVIGDPVPVALGVTDLSERPNHEREEALSRLLTAGARRPFDLARDPMLRASLVRLAADEHVLLLVIHHIASDLWAWEVFFRELGALYAGFAQGQPVSLPPVPLQYRDYAAAEQERLNLPATATQLDFWREQLAGAPSRLELATDHPRPAEISFRGAIARRALPARLSAELRALSVREDVTPFMTLLAAFQVLLARTTQQTDLVIGVPSAGRTQPGTEGMIGLCVNTLPLRGDLAGDPNFPHLLQQTKMRSLDGLNRSDVPFDRLVEALRPVREPGTLPLVQVMFTAQAAVGAGAGLPGLVATPVPVDTGAAHFDLTLVVELHPDRLELSLEYATDLFTAETARRMLEHYEVLLEGIAADPDRPISRLPLLAPAERQQLLTDWNRTAVAFPTGLCLHALFEERARAQPDAEALVVGDSRLTYWELNRRADRLAAHLRTLGIGPEVRVAICLDRSADLIVALLAVLKSGGAYVGLEPTYPAERLAYILQDSQAKLILTQRRLLPLLPADGAPSVCVDALALPAGRAEATTSAGPTEHNLAYVVYTSGSTGRPKGVAIEHRSSVAFVQWAGTAFDADAWSGVLASTSICFDLSIFEIFGPLAHGGKIILADHALALPDLPAANEVRLLNIVPSVMAELLRTGNLPPSVETVTFGGEALPQAIAEQTYTQPSVRKVYDLYGPSETTTYSTVALRVPGGRATIGRPIANTETYVLDSGLEPVPIGVAGELYLGGAGLARGYLDRPELTAERFIRHPFSAHPEARLYRTGDLCRYRPDGNLEYLGRFDQQVKILGNRIELGEVEAALRAHPAVGELCVAAREDAAGVLRLAAYLVIRPGLPQPDELRAWLQRTLPSAMIPTAFVVVDRLPLNANGKVDRRALPPPAPEAAAPAAAPIAPRDELERSLVKIWASVLGVDRVGVTDQFFDLGGHSLLAVRLAARIERELGRKLSVAAIFRAPSVAQLAELLRRDDHTALVAIQAQGTRPPLFLVHSMGSGIMWGYANLARHLDEDQPVFAFQPSEPATADAFDTVEEMAGRYLAEMRQLQPRGPYRLGGYCFGGNIAYEMARQLEAEGETVEVLALLNAWPANAGHDRIPWTKPGTALKFIANLHFWAGRMLTWQPQARLRFLRWKLQTLPRKLIAGFRHVPAEDEQNVELFVDLSATPIAERRLWAAHLRALRHYHPGPYGGAVTLMRTKGYPFFSSYDAGHGWGEFARGGVEIRYVPGMHETLMLEPHVAALGRELAAQLD